MKTEQSDRDKLVGLNPKVAVVKEIVATKDYSAPLVQLHEYLSQVPEEVAKLAFGFKKFLDEYFPNTLYEHSIKTGYEFPMGDKLHNHFYVNYKITVSESSMNLYHDDVQITKKIVLRIKHDLINKQEVTLFEESKIV
jgi:hypothetical protein